MLGPLTLTDPDAERIAAWEERENRLRQAMRAAVDRFNLSLARRVMDAGHTPSVPPNAGQFSEINLGSDYTDEEFALLKALDRYKVTNRRPHPTIRELLVVVISLGYEKKS